MVYYFLKEGMVDDALLILQVNQMDDVFSIQDPHFWALSRYRHYELFETNLKALQKTPTSRSCVLNSVQRVRLQARR